MANKRFLFVILAITLVLGMTVVSCDDDSTPKTDSALNGTWVGSGMTWVLNNGDFTLSDSTSPYYKGTYTTSSNSNITIKMTQIWGGNPVFEGSALQAKWYTRNEIKTLGASEADLDTIFMTLTGTYTVTSTTLTLSLDSVGTATLTKSSN